MRNRHIIIILTILIGIGAYAHQAEATACPTLSTCASSHNTGHGVVFNTGSCFCPPWGAQLTGRCGSPDISSQWMQQAFTSPDLKSSWNHMPANAPAGWSRIPTAGRAGPHQSLHKSDSPLAYPIYLRTLTLLC